MDSIGDIILVTAAVADKTVLNRDSLAQVGDLLDECDGHGRAIKEKLSAAVVILVSRITDLEESTAQLAALTTEGDIGESANRLSVARESINEAVQVFMGARDAGDTAGLMVGEGVLRCAAATRNMMAVVGILRGWSTG